MPSSRFFTAYETMVCNQGTHKHMKVKATNSHSTNNTKGMENHLCEKIEEVFKELAITTEETILG